MPAAEQTTLYPFQEDGVQFIADSGFRCILADQVGLGKTVQALVAAHRHIPPDPPGPLVFVTPAHLKINWRREARKHLNRHVEILSGHRPDPDRLPPGDPNTAFVLNYDVLIPPSKIKNSPAWPARTHPPRDSWTAWLAALHPRLVVCDEAHTLSDPTSLRTRAVRWLSRRVPRVVLLTATPLMNQVINLWSLLNIVRPAEFGSRVEFGMEFTNAHKKWYGWQFPGARNLDALNRRLVAAGALLRRRKQDVLGELPLLTRSVVPVAADLREYRRAEADFIGWLEQQSPKMAEKAAKAETVTRMMALWRLAGVAKLSAVMDHVEGILDGGTNKLILGALHKKVTYPLIDAYGGTGRAVLVDGDLSDRQKQECFDRFNRDRRCRLLIGNLQAAGTGWSCTSTSDVAVCEFPWRPADLTQFFGRIDGLERGVPGVAAHARMFVAEGTLDEDLVDVLDRKTRWAKLAVDGGAGGDESTIRAAVLAAVRTRAGAAREGVRA